MNLTQKLSLFILCICILDEDRIWVASQNEKPEILEYKYETVIEANHNHTVLCQGNRPLKWTTPTVEKDKQHWTKIIEENYKPLKKSYLYGRRLQIVNMSYPFFGFYYCHYENSQTNNPKESTKIYLYVNDADHFTTLKIKPNSVTDVYGLQYREAIIPCRPTSPDIDVKLIDYETGKPISLDVLYPNNTIFRFDRLYGFITNATNTSYNPEYQCVFNKGNNTQKALVELNIEKPVAHLETPYLEDLNNGHTLVGNKLTLNCTSVNKNRGVYFHWRTPTGPVNEHRMYKNNHAEKMPNFEWKTVENLTINGTTKLDNGTYICKVTDNQEHSSSVSLDVQIFDVNEHFLKMERDNDLCSTTVSSEESIHWNITVKGHPKPFVKWLNNKNEKIPMENGTKYEAHYNRNTAFLKIKKINIRDFGYFTLLAENKETKRKICFLNVTDKPSVELDVKPFQMVNKLNTMKCHAFANPVPEFYWYYKSCQSCDYTPVKGTVSKIKKVEFVEFVSEVTVKTKESGFLKCVVKNDKGNSSATKEYYISDIKNGFDIYSLDDDVDVDEHKKIVTIVKGDRAAVTCGASNQTYSNITWLFNNTDLTNNNRYMLTRTRTKYSNKLELKIQQADISYRGLYSCRVTNQNGKYVFQNITFNVSNARQMSDSWSIIIIILLGVVSIGTTIYILFKVKQEKQLQRELKLLGLTNFQNGAVENINPELGIDEQAELLPYDQKWEIPIEYLKIGKQLGSGAFGVVKKGVVKKLVEGEDETTVAVKMTKENADNTHIKALASELKIMVHLGKHVNVVNLLGACTKNVAKRELLVIVEFCRFGNLQNYLLRHRGNYIDQVDTTGKIDYMIGQEFFDRSYSISSEGSSAYPLLKYTPSTSTNNSNQTGAPSNYYNGNHTNNSNSERYYPIEDTTLQGTDGEATSNNSVQPNCISNYGGDYKGNVKPICTTDLLVWAFQVARGMQYLAFRKVLHGDLAARNILLADNNVVKICDFGLAKSMYKNDNYKKQGKGPLPVKWMAIESIRDGIFSTQSDVWSFGIVLWEFFSLARTPYPGMEAERLCEKLMDGYRMENPRYAPKEVYKMMTDCWLSRPLARPSFEMLSERLGSLLEESTRTHFVDLNGPYVEMNTQRLRNGQSDYLAMLNPPTFDALSSPNYQNHSINQNLFKEVHYANMEPNAIFSPREEGEHVVFNFNVDNRKPSEEGEVIEMLPMLERDSDSGCDSPLQSPTTPNGFSNPSYHIIPKTGHEEVEDCSNKGSKMGNHRRQAIISTCPNPSVKRDL